MEITKKLFFKILEEQNILKTTQNKPIVDAIVNRNPITFFYTGPRKPKEKSVKQGRRINAEAVAMGINSKGNLVIRAYVQPPSVSKKGFNEHGWRTFMVSRMSRIEVNKNTQFNQKKPNYKEGDESPRYGGMRVTYVKSNWETTTPVKKEPKPTEEPIKKIEPLLPQPKSDEKPEPTPVEPNKEIKPSNELPQPKPEEKPKENPEEEKIFNDLYNKKLSDWKKSQSSLNKNTNAGEGTRNRLKKETEDEIKNKQTSQLNENIKRIKTLMLL